MGNNFVNPIYIASQTPKAAWDPIEHNIDLNSINVNINTAGFWNLEGQNT